MEENTAPGTLWSRTLIDLLVSAVERRDRAEIMRLLKRIKARGLRKGDVLRSARARLDSGQMALLEQAIKSMGHRRAGGDEALHEAG